MAFNLKYLLRNPEPISVFVPVTVTEGGRKVVDSVERIPEGIFEIQDQNGTTMLTGSGERVDQSATLFGSVSSLLVAGREMKVNGHGVHAGRRYKLGVPANLETHLEIPLEDVRA